MNVLTEADQTLLPLALRQNGGFHLASQWYLRGWTPQAYQYAYHQARQLNTTFLAGVAAGKTNSSAASCLIDCISIPYFKCLNTSVTAKQAELPYDMFMGWFEGNPRLEHLVENIKRRPWPLVTFKNFSVWEFRTAGTDARFIRGTEYDRIVYDEAGLDFLGETVKVLRSRLRGVRYDGTHRMARLDVITSPTDAPWLRERFDRGWRESDIADLASYISFRVRTCDNKSLTPEQVRLMEAEYTDEMRAVEMDAEFPDYGLSMFPKRHIHACTSQAMYDETYEAVSLDSPKEGYNLEEHPRHGVTKLEMPYNPDHTYVLAGDPGQDDPPRRNAPCVGVLDITTTPAKLVYFHWPAGRGSYNPFLESFRYAMTKYRPINRGLDTTSTQKGMQEIAFTNLGIETDGINFSSEKEAALNALNYAVTNHELQWPMIKGLIRQMSVYNRDEDRTKKVPQDIVMMLAMAALLRQRNLPQLHGANTPSRVQINRTVRTNRRRRR